MEVDRAFNRTLMNLSMIGPPSTPRSTYKANVFAALKSKTPLHSVLPCTDTALFTSTPCININTHSVRTVPLDVSTGPRGIPSFNPVTNNNNAGSYGSMNHLSYQQADHEDKQDEKAQVAADFSFSSNDEFRVDVTEFLSPKARVFCNLKSSGNVSTSHAPQSLLSATGTSTILPSAVSDIGKSPSRKLPASSRTIDTSRTAADILADLGCHLLPDGNKTINNRELDDVFLRPFNAQPAKQANKSVNLSQNSVLCDSNHNNVSRPTLELKECSVVLPSRSAVGAGCHDDSCRDDNIDDDIDCTDHVDVPLDSSNVSNTRRSTRQSKLLKTKMIARVSPVRRRHAPLLGRRRAVISSSLDEPESDEQLVSEPELSKKVVIVPLDRQETDPSLTTDPSLKTGRDWAKTADTGPRVGRRRVKTSSILNDTAADECVLIPGSTEDVTSSKHRSGRVDKRCVPTAPNNSSFAFPAPTTLNSSVDDDVIVRAKRRSNKPKGLLTTESSSQEDTDIDVLIPNRRDSKHRDSAETSRLDRTSHLSLTKSMCKVEDQLENWSLLMLRDGRVRLEGFRNGSRRVHSTKAVVKRLSSTVIETSSGSRYKLVGPARQNKSHELCGDILHQFEHGFPWNWRELLQLASLQLEQEKLSRSHVPQHNTTTKLDATSATFHGADKTSRLFTDEPVSQADLPRSRSGRLLVPPLASWANQRLRVTVYGDRTDLVQGTENVLSTNNKILFKEPKLPRRLRTHNSTQRINNNSTRCKQMDKAPPSDDNCSSAIELSCDSPPTVKRKQHKKDSKQTNKSASLVNVMNSTLLEVSFISDDLSDVEPSSFTNNYFSDEDS